MRDVIYECSLRPDSKVVKAEKTSRKGARLMDGMLNGCYLHSLKRYSKIRTKKSYFTPYHGEKFNTHKNIQIQLFYYNDSHLQHSKRVGVFQGTTQKMLQ